LTEALADIFKKAGASKLIEYSKIVLLWKDCVTPEIAKQTEAVKIRNRILYVETRSPVWAQELNFFKEDIKEKLNQKAGYQAINDIRFKAGG
jgi:predicted nucleic acid-binding Zn ribbon protein